MKCKKCGTSFVPGGENKFCESCGTELPMVAAEAVAPKAAPANDDELPAAGTSPSTAIGKNSILSNSQINTTNTTTTTTVNNTTIEDDTKKSIVCAVSGKRVLYIESVCCRGCDKDVSLEYYNETTRRCENCHKGYLNQYREVYKKSLESEGGIDRHERAELNIVAQQLFLSEEEKLNIETELRNLKSSEIESNTIGYDDLFDMELSIVKNEIFVKNNLTSAFLRLEDLFKQVQTDDEISCFYFLLKAIKLPGQYITNYESASYDEFWEHYWLFLAYMNKGDQGKAMKTFRDNHFKFSHRKNEIILSEIVYFMLRFESDKTDILIQNALNKLASIENISGNLLTKLYKSNEKLLNDFDFGLLKFSELTPPDEPGMREYFLFFVNHLYKIAPEVPKVEPAAAKSVTPPPNVASTVIPEAPKQVNTAPVVPKLPTRPTEVVQSPTSNGPKPVGPKLPGLPPQPTTKVEADPSMPKLPGMPPGAKASNPGPKLPQTPNLPPTPANNKVNLPKIPPVPGKK